MENLQCLKLYQYAQNSKTFGTLRNLYLLARRDVTTIDEWQKTSWAGRVRSGTFVNTSFDFLMPKILPSNSTGICKFLQVHTCWISTSLYLSNYQWQVRCSLIAKAAFMINKLLSGAQSATGWHVTFQPKFVLGYHSVRILENLIHLKEFDKEIWSKSIT